MLPRSILKIKYLIVKNNILKTLLAASKYILLNALKLNKFKTKFLA